MAPASLCPAPASGGRPASSHVPPQTSSFRACRLPLTRLLPCLRPTPPCRRARPTPAAPGRRVTGTPASGFVPLRPTSLLAGSPPARPAPEHRHFRAGSAPAETPRPPTGTRGPASPRLGRLRADPAPVPGCLLAAVPASSAPAHPARAGSPPLPHPTQAGSSVPATPNLAPPPGLSAGRPRFVGSCPCRSAGSGGSTPGHAGCAGCPASQPARCDQCILWSAAPEQKEREKRGPAARIEPAGKISGRVPSKKKEASSRLLVQKKGRLPIRH
nr:atherin-like [Aegilops tauschii subsp. strangulata]